MKGQDFERCLVDTMAEMAEAKGLKHKRMAIAAWPDKKDPGTKWRKIRNGQDPRGFQVQDAYDLASAMGVSFLELCGIAQGRLMQMEAASHQVAVPLKKEVPQIEAGETDDMAGSTLPARKQGGGVQPFLGGSS